MCGRECAGPAGSETLKKILPPFLFVLNTVVKIALGVCITTLSWEIIGRESVYTASLCRACKNLDTQRNEGWEMAQ